MWHFCDEEICMGKLDIMLVIRRKRSFNSTNIKHHTTFHKKKINKWI